MFKTRVIRLVAFVIVLFVSLSYVATLEAFQTHNIVDDKHFLTQEQVEKLQKKCDDMISRLHIEPVIVITDVADKTTMEFADDYYDANGYGVGEDHSGLLMAVDMQNRTLWISETGKGIDIITDKRREAILDEVTPFATGHNYFELCNQFLSQVDKYAIHDSQTTSYAGKIIYMAKTPFPYVVSLAGSILIVLCWTAVSRPRATVEKAAYEESGSFVLDHAEDRFLTETTTSVRIEKPSSGGGGGTHVGSSGTTHSGSGRSF